MVSWCRQFSARSHFFSQQKSTWHLERQTLPLSNGRVPWHEEFVPFFGFATPFLVWKTAAHLRHAPERKYDWAKLFQTEVLEGDFSIDVEDVIISHRPFISCGFLVEGNQTAMAPISFWTFLVNQTPVRNELIMLDSFMSAFMMYSFPATVVFEPKEHLGISNRSTGQQFQKQVF